jgi:flagellum-specific ATP synthase
MDDVVGIPWKKAYSQFKFGHPFSKVGKVSSSKGGLYEINLSRANLGCTVEFITEKGDRSLGEVVGIHGNKCLAMPYEDLNGINSETRVVLKDLTTTIKLSPNLLGRVVDFQGNPIDGKGDIAGPYENRSILGRAINPLHRPQIEECIDTGVASLNSFLTLGKGQRIAIMAGSGVGKSVLLGMVARNTNSDINVIALIGERGREVLELIKNDLGEEGLKRSVIVVATSDLSPLIRIKAAYTATAIAEYFRDRNHDVLLMMDSITRFAMASREIALSAGEPPGQKGYTPSVFSKLPKLMERAGTIDGGGSITGIYTVLVEGGDMDEPIADAVRSISDGHIVLSRELASKNMFPAIDILASISRVMNKVITKEHHIVANYLKDLFAAYKNSEDLINVGAYVSGTNPVVDKAVVIIDELHSFLKQEIDSKVTLEEAYDRMVSIAKKAESSINPDLFKKDE